MKNYFKYLSILCVSLMFTSCLVEDETISDDYDKGPNVVTFDRVVDHLTGVAETGGAEYDFLKRIRVAGPTVKDLTNDIVVDVVTADGTTADGTMYTINNLPLTLTAENNYLGQIEFTLTTLGNEPPLEGEPGYDTYVAPQLNLQLTVTGDPNVIASGKLGQFALNFTPPNPWAGEYSSHVIYRHPDAGTYPDNINSEDDYTKSWVGVTANQMESNWFAVWDDVISWITVNPDNSISYLVNEADWEDDVSLGDPNRPDLISYYDPATRIIYMYYHYCRSNGCRIFWETLEPNF